MRLPMSLHHSESQASVLQVRTRLSVKPFLRPQNEVQTPLYSSEVLGDQLCSLQVPLPGLPAPVIWCHAHIFVPLAHLSFFLSVLNAVSSTWNTLFVSAVRYFLICFYSSTIVTGILLNINVAIYRHQFCIVNSAALFAFKFLSVWVIFAIFKSC